MEPFSALLAICAGNSPVTGEFHTQRPMTRSFGVFFDLRLNKRLTKHSWGWWFETPSCPLWCDCNEQWHRTQYFPKPQADICIFYNFSTSKLHKYSGVLPHEGQAVSNYPNQCLFIRINFSKIWIQIHIRVGNIGWKFLSLQCVDNVLTCHSLHGASQNLHHCSLSTSHCHYAQIQTDERILRRFA